MRKFKYNNNGSQILIYIFIIILFLSLGQYIIPQFNIVIKERSEKTLNVYNTTDTVVK